MVKTMFETSAETTLQGYCLKIKAIRLIEVDLAGFSHCPKRNFNIE